MENLTDLSNLLLSSSIAIGFTRLQHCCMAIQRSIQHANSTQPQPRHIDESLEQIRYDLQATEEYVADLEVIMEQYFSTLNNRRRKDDLVNS